MVMGFDQLQRFQNIFELVNMPLCMVKHKI